MQPLNGDPFLYEIELNYMNDGRGILTSRETYGPVYAAAAKEFGGQALQWTPEHLLVSALSTCYMTTLLLFVKKEKLELVDFECRATGAIKLKEGKYVFDRIDLFPKMKFGAQDKLETILATVENARKYCIVSNSIKAPVFYHPDISTGKEGGPWA